MKHFGKLGARARQFSWNELVRRFGSQIGEQPLQKPQKPHENVKKTLRCLVIGGGPSGLAFATSLRLAADPTSVEITVADGRWLRERGRIRWRDIGEGTNRRQQVVTIQSRVYSRLHPRVRAAIFPEGSYSQVWPTGGESPAELGYPRNIRIMDIEDGLLELASDVGINLRLGRIEPADIDLRRWDLVVVSDGASSRTREFFSSFGLPDSTPYSISGEPVVDTVLGLRVQSLMTDASSVVMTVAQNRFLLNARGRDGMLYMRLTLAEAAEVRGRMPDGQKVQRCEQSDPCRVTWRSDNGQFVCDRTKTVFVPSVDPGSALWPRILEGLALFEIQPASIEAITAFELSMTRRGAFTAELTPSGSDRPVFGALLGDAAGVTHFWPGRGLNRGLSGAHALARILSRRSSENPLRNADFAPFEAVMAALQHRHQDRAWRSMVQMREGVTVPISTIVSDAIARPRGERCAMLEVMRERVRNLIVRLDGRLPEKPSEAELFAALDTASDETLAVLVESQAWETRWSGGAEIDVDGLLKSLDD